MIAKFKMKSLNPFRKRSVRETSKEVLVRDSNVDRPLDTVSLLSEAPSEPSPAASSCTPSTFFDGTVHSIPPSPNVHTTAPRVSFRFPTLLRSAHRERLKRRIRLGLRIIVQPIISFTPFASRAVEPSRRPPSPYYKTLNMPPPPTSVPEAQLHDSPTFDPETPYSLIPSEYTTSVTSLQNEHPSVPASPHLVQISPTSSQSAIPSIPSARSSHRWESIERRRNRTLDEVVCNWQVHHVRSVPAFPPGLESEEIPAFSNPAPFLSSSAALHDGEGQTNELDLRTTSAARGTATTTRAHSSSAYYDIDDLTSIPSASSPYSPASAPWIEEREINVSPVSSLPDLRFIPDIQSASRDSSLESRISPLPHASSQRQPIFVSLPFGGSTGLSDGGEL